MPIPIAKIVDRAGGNSKPIFPKPILIYLIALILGLIIPIIIISILSSLDNKVHRPEDIQSIIEAPFIGNIPQSRSNKKIVISNSETSNLAESFRLLRTNLSYLLSNVDQNSKTIFVTSTVAGEGKTFVAINLAKSLSLINKKVLIIGADIRKPKLAQYLNLKVEKGLTRILIDKSIKIKDIIVTDEINGFDVIDSGEIPPNPSELLINERIGELFQYARENYDYVLVDTPPVNLVSDTLVIGKFADLIIYVVRAEYLDKRALEVPKLMLEDKRLPNMALLLNGTIMEKEGYGYGYGYGYGRETTKSRWWNKIIG